MSLEWSIFWIKTSSSSRQQSHRQQQQQNNISIYRKFSLTTAKLELGVLRQCRCLASHYFWSSLMASWSLRSKITGSALKLNWQCQNLNFFLKKTWSIFGANLLHLNLVLSNIPGCPFWLWLFHENLVIICCSSF